MALSDFEGAICHQISFKTAAVWHELNGGIISHILQSIGQGKQSKIENQTKNRLRTNLSQLGKSLG